MPNDNVLTDIARRDIEHALRWIQPANPAHRILSALLDLHPGQPEPPTFEAKHVSLKQKGKKMILTLELDGVEGAPRYAVTPINPGVVRVQPEPRAEVTLFADNDERDEFIRACQDFDDDGETRVDYGLLMKWASDGLLDCGHFTITKKGRAAIDAARAGGA